MSKKLPEGWNIFRFKDLFDLKQGKNLSINELHDNGYSVFGANGKIGYYNEYMYDQKVLLVTCRGATCGSINITEEKSWVTGNSIALIPKKDLNINFYKFYLKYISFIDVISGSAQPQIIVSKLNEKKIMEIPLEEQERIVSILEKAENAIEKREESIKLLDEYLKSVFVDIFGNPVTNSKGWEVEELSKVLINIENGKSFVCENCNREGNYPAILKLSAVTYGVYNPLENKALIDEKSFVANSEVKKGDLLFTRKNTPELVGMSAYVYETTPNLMMPDLIFRLNTNEQCNKIYLWQLINHRLFRENIKALSNGSAKSMSNISKQRLMMLEVPVPPIELQNEFADFAKQADKMKFKMENSLKELENNFNSLMQKAFNGEL
ncbi:MAG: restriction endonuclease subunit S [Paraclostridium dentum]|uniref:restriction endonuclease subunit S n=1 Tax=Paraclostridium dentum TaxID=2662455 RepID=UPI003EE80DE7